MAKVRGVATLEKDGYKDMHCLFCGYFMKVKIYPFNKVKKLIKCDRCKTKHKLLYIEKDDEFEMTISVSTANKVVSEAKLVIS